MHPDLTLLSMTFSTWSVLIVVGVVTAWVAILTRTKRLGYSSIRVYVWLVSMFPLGVLGAAAVAGVVKEATGPTATSEGGGMTVIGSIIVCSIGSFLMIRLMFKEAPWRLMDIAAFSFPLALMMGRLGCLMNGCCFGAPAASVSEALPFPFTVPVASYAPDTAAAGFYESAAADLAVWNLPLLLSLLALCTLVATEFIYRRKARWRLVHGTVFVATLTIDAGTRFFAEFLRQEEALSWLPFNPWQSLVLLVFFLGVGCLWLLLKRRQPADEQVAGASRAGMA